jgi:tRNA-2-methylthio-N6-dimethylallyladenosine synthase
MKTYHIITIGCQMNKSDSERMASLLEQQGYKKTDKKYQSDLVVVNTCGIRQMAEDRIYGLIPAIKKANKKAKIILTGCLVNRKDVKNRLKKYVDVWKPINEITKIPLAPFIKGGKCPNDYLKIEPKYESKFSAYVPIGNGCNNFCSYCVVPYARGREVCRPAKEILAEVKKLVKNDYKEIVLIAQNVNSYKSQIPPNPPLSRGDIDFADLLKMVDEIKGDFWIRFITSHPKDMSDKLIKVIAGSKKICHHIHLPIQAGDDKILALMNRKYTVAHYKSLIKKIRKAIPDASITTDIIVGFPSETKKQSNNTAKLMKETKFDLAYVVRYSPRPGTASFKLIDNVSLSEKKVRENKLTKILSSTALANNKKYLGKIVKVLVEGENKRDELFGSTETAKIVKISTGDFNQRLPRSPGSSPGLKALPRNDSLVGRFVDVKIIKAKDFGLEGKLVKKKLLV